MSSLRNAVKRRTHKERSQPGERNRLGLLEKHKDYVLRAKDFHRKEKSIQGLKEKASFKNPDEFYYKMINSKTIDGVHKPKSGKRMTVEEALLMKTQDSRYVVHKAQSERKMLFTVEQKVEQLRAVLHCTGQPPCNTHVYFADDRQEAESIQKRLALAAVDKQQKSKELPRHIKKMQKAAYQELEERTERAEKLKNMAISMTLQREIMGKGKKRKVCTVGGEPVYEWAQERKK